MYDLKGKKAKKTARFSRSRQYNLILTSYYDINNSEVANIVFFANNASLPVI